MNVPTYTKKRHIFYAGMWDDAHGTALTTHLRLRVVTEETRALLYCAGTPPTGTSPMSRAGPVTSIATLAATDRVEVIVENVGTSPLTGTAHVTLGWEPA